MRNVKVKKINRPSVTEFVTVIVRAYENEPVLLQAIGANENTVQVVGEDTSLSVSFPIQWIYSYSEEMYKQLLDAYQAGNSEQLRALWKTASKFDGWK